MSVLGEHFSQEPEIFGWARERFAGRILHWGFLERREAYFDVLARADVVVSTAKHEFFGIAVVEAIAAGCLPVLPCRLAYPEILAPLPARTRERFFYDGSVAALSGRLVELARAKEEGALWPGDPELCQRVVERYQWSRVRPLLDDGLTRLGAEQAGEVGIGYPFRSRSSAAPTPHYDEEESP